MKTVIRKGVFETNSSSMHSIALQGRGNALNKYDRPIWGQFGEFGWGYETYNNPSGKLSYALTAIQYKDRKIGRRLSDDKLYDRVLKSKYFLWLNEMVRDFTGYDIEMEEGSGEYYSCGYIDHQSIEDGDATIDPFWSDDEEEFKELMKDFIFNEKWYLIIDNDNH